MADIDLESVLAEGDYVQRSGGTLVGKSAAEILAEAGGLSGSVQVLEKTVTFPDTVAQGDISGAGAVRFDRAGTLLYVSVSTDVAPVTASVIVDANKNGTTIFSTQANRPTVATASTYNRSTTPNTTAVAQGDRLQFEFDQLNASDEGNLGQVYVTVAWTEAIG